MGYTTYFDGAIKVTPKVDPLVCTNLNIWLGMRHCKASELPSVTAEYADKAWEPDGPKIPSPGKAVGDFVAKRPKAKMFAFDEISNMVHVPEPPYGSANVYNETCYPHTSLWSDVRIYQDYDCSYIAWNENEKSYEMEHWFEFLVTLLTNMGYTCEGIIKAQGEDYDDRWTVVCKNGVTERIEGHSQMPTYEDELMRITSRLATIWE